MANFSSAELQLINRQRKPAGEKPFYFSSDEGIFKEVSDDFEAYLILQTVDHKEETVEWIETSLDILEANEDRDELLERYIELRIEDASARVNELDGKLEDFNSFKEGLLEDRASGDPTRFASIVEVNLLARSLQRPLDEILFLREKAFHEINLASLMLFRLNLSRSNDATQREIDSWENVITAYPGQDI